MTERWEERAACKGDDTEKWFPIMFTDNPDYEDAVEICDWCHVKMECLRTALTEKIHYGIWGGLTPDQRKQIAKRISRKRTPVTQVDLLPHVDAVT